MQKWLIILCLFLISGCANFNAVDPEQFEIDTTTVTDKKTGLMWAASDNNESLTWQEAVEYCDNYSGGGYQDWRMPKKSELTFLIKSKIEKDGEVINLSSNLIWATETDDSNGAFCNFKTQTCSWMEQVISISLHALPVRDTKSPPLVTSTPPPATKPQSTKQRLQILDQLHKQQLITEDEYNRKKARILDEL